MKHSQAIVGLILLVSAGCGEKESEVVAPPALVLEVIQRPEPQEPPAPKAEFDPANKERSFLWIKDEATALESEFKPAKQAVSDNPLNDDMLNEFIARKLPPYRARIESIVGREIAWKVAVHEVSDKGVFIWADENYLTEPFVNDGKPKSSIYVQLYIVNDNVNAEYRAERSTLRLGKQITRNFAKTLKYGDLITLKGRIERLNLLYGEKQPPSFVEIYVGDATSDSR